MERNIEKMFSEKKEKAQIKPTTPTQFTLLAYFFGEKFFFCVRSIYETWHIIVTVEVCQEASALYLFLWKQNTTLWVKPLLGSIRALNVGSFLDMNWLK